MTSQYMASSALSREGLQIKAHRFRISDRSLSKQFKASNPKTHDSQSLLMQMVWNTAIDAIALQDHRMISYAYSTHKKLVERISR